MASAAMSPVSRSPRAVRSNGGPDLDVASRYRAGATDAGVIGGRRPSTSSPRSGYRIIQGEHLSSIGLPAKGWFGVWFPAHTMWEHERKLSSWLGSDRSFRWDGREGCWTVASANFPRISRELLRRYPSVLIGREYNPHEKCNSSCRNAQGFLCTCSCRAKYHGRGKWRSGWKTLGEFSGLRAGSPWHWMVIAVAG